jgi:3-hydroxyisobutyrate dehydrogenase
MEKIGFIGLGLMGLPMCRGCRRPASRSPSGTARPDKLEKPAPRHATTTSLAELAAASDILMLCIADAAAVQSVVAQLQPALRAGQLIIDLSSIDPDTTRRCAEQVSQQGASWVDAPVSGGVRVRNKAHW